MVPVRRIDQLCRYNNAWADTPYAAFKDCPYTVFFAETIQIHGPVFCIEPCVCGAGTRKLVLRARLVVKSSVSPSTKRSVDGFSLRLTKGSTATEPTSGDTPFVLLRAYGTRAAKARPNAIPARA